MTPEELCRLVGARKDRFPDDPFRDIRAGTDAHRADHGCWAYPYADGSRLGTVSAAVGARRIVELGTALGYTALWLAHGAAGAHVDTIDRDPDHVRLARENFAAAGLSERITVHEGDFEAVLATLDPGYDVAFFDGYAPALGHLEAFSRLLRPAGVLISANLSMGEAAAYRRALADRETWRTAFLRESHDTAISMRPAAACRAAGVTPLRPTPRP